MPMVPSKGMSPCQASKESDGAVWRGILAESEGKEIRSRQLSRDCIRLFIGLSSVGIA